MKKIQAIRGMTDILPEATPIWRHVEKVLTAVMDNYGYQEIRFPIVEHTELFKRTVGEVTDIVEKEMYTFADRNGESLTLRPEGTAGCVRAGVESGLFYNQIQRLWYKGPFFRHERPQKGRYRQFHQFGAEAFGLAGPSIDAEIILITARLWKRLGLTKGLVLQLNSLGSVESRAAYRKKLVNYFSIHEKLLDEESEKRLKTNPLRILDSKNAEMHELIHGAPKMIDSLDEESKKHFDELCSLLDAAQLPYEINPFLVRGLDYYTRTVFEWVTDQLGAQGTVCAGGRFDGLVEQLGSYSVPAIGFALGLERLVALLVESTLFSVTHKPHLYLIMVGQEAEVKGLMLAEQWRDQFPNVRLLMNSDGGSFKTQFKRADKSGAEVALVLAEEEMKNNCVTIKYLRSDKPQDRVSEEALQEQLRQLIEQDYA